MIHKWWYFISTINKSLIEESSRLSENISPSFQVNCSTLCRFPESNQQSLLPEIDLTASRVDVFLIRSVKNVVVEISRWTEVDFVEEEVVVVDVEVLGEEQVVSEDGEEEVVVVVAEEATVEDQEEVVAAERISRSGPLLELWAAWTWG